MLVYCNNNALLDHQSAPVYRKKLLTLYPWLIPLINCGLGAVQVKRTVVELTASACTFPGGTVGTDPEEVKKKHYEVQAEWKIKVEGERGRQISKGREKNGNSDETWKEKPSRGAFRPTSFRAWESGSGNFLFLLIWGGKNMPITPGVKAVASGSFQVNPAAVCLKRACHSDVTPENSQGVAH